MNSPHTIIGRLMLAALTSTALFTLHATAQGQPANTTRSPSAITTSPNTNPRPTSNTTQPYAASTPTNTNNQRSNNTQSITPNNSTAPLAPLPLATDPAYKLSLGDELTIDVHGEPDMSTAQRIDQDGNVRVPQLSEVNLNSKTVREAESYLEKLYIEKKLLKKPLVNINVREYSSRQVTIIGSVNGPGIFHLPREADFIEIVDLITSIGGFRPTAKSDNVRVTRTTDDGKETTFYVDVDAMIYNKRNALKSFKVYAGDRILVTERLWETRPQTRPMRGSA